ncbi:IS481 family transposase [Curtobacterium ammoniigenes]|uniref:IS481 family transposase n=1 Tax=Curtobacterium ammoniigenes TaxID=395387 RepID=UPI00082FEC23|nr:IS481 family transposase [Curtobacterium ammoniigenes]
MTHRNAPLSVEGRRRLIDRCRTRPISHVAQEMGISRACASKWVNRWRAHGDLGLEDRSSAPGSSPAATPPALVDRIEQLRRDGKQSARRIVLELAADEITISVRTLTRVLDRLGLNRRRHIDPDGDSNRAPRKIVARYPGHMVHLDVKKVGRIPDGGGWRVHGRGSDQHRASGRARTKDRSIRSPRPGYVFLHSAVDGHSRLAYTEHLPDEKASTTIGFFHRARAFFTAHGIVRLTRVVTDNGSNFRADAFHAVILAHAARHQRTRPYTPRHNGKVERYNRILAEEFLYARTFTSEQQRADALQVWNVHYNYHRPHTATGNQPPASKLRTGVTNVMASYS